MNKYLLSLLAVTSVASAMDSGSFEKRIKLPSREVLRNRLAEQGFNYFMEKTKIDKTLADKKLFPSGVGIAVECAMCDFNRYIKKSSIGNQRVIQAILGKMLMRKEQLIECILQDYPQAIKEVKEQGFLN